MAKQNVDVVIHLGDYIYEYGADGYATEEAVKLGRTLAVDNNKEIIKLDDYRKRYALYRTDKDLQALHHRHPFIVIWDDHEFTNDTWREENHQPNEGRSSFLDRKLAALQAYLNGCQFVLQMNNTPEVSKEPKNPPVTPQKPEIVTSGDDEELKCVLPARGKWLSRYSENGNKGLDIAGNKGQAIFSCL